MYASVDCRIAALVVSVVSHCSCSVEASYLPPLLTILARGFPGREGFSGSQTSLD